MSTKINKKRVSRTSQHNLFITNQNKLKGIDRLITREQAQSQEDINRDYNWSTIDDTQAKELAITLGLAS